MLTDEQKQNRQGGIGGSDVAVILGLSNFKTPFELYKEKRGELKRDDEMNERQYWGHLLEHPIREHFIREHNVEYELPSTLYHPLYDFMLGHVDGYIIDYDAIHEIKCAGVDQRHKWGEDGSDFIPMEYLVQVAYYCAIKNCKSAYISVLIGGNDYREYKYTRDLELESEIIDAVKAFWNSVITGKEPELKTLSDVKLKYQIPEPVEAQTTDTVLPHLQALTDIKERQKELKEKEDFAKKNIMQHMKEAEVLRNDARQIVATWKANKRGTRTFLLKGM